MVDRMLSFGGDVRCIGEWRFEENGFVQILVGGNVPTDKAIQYAEMMLSLKKDELQKLALAKADEERPAREAMAAALSSTDRTAS